jgi:hypothetical protein
VAKKKPDRTISSGAGGPAQLYLFVDVASFTEDWADLKLGDDELRALEDEIARNPTREPVVPGAGGARKLRRPDPLSGRARAAVIVFYTPFCLSTGQFSSSPRGPSRSVRTWNVMTTRPSERSSRAFKHIWIRGGVCE